jgi:hypothetical protein
VTRRSQRKGGADRADAPTGQAVGWLRQAALSGVQVTRLGEVAVASPTPALAAALSPGRLPKQPPSVDPNEDGVLVAAGAGRALLAVVDAHYGYASGAAALAAVGAGLPDLLAADRRALPSALQRLVRQVLEAVAIGVRPQPASATALSIALVERRRLLAVTFGDTVVVRVSRRGAARRIGRTRGFAGARAPAAAIEQARLAPGDRVLVATDGLTDYLGSAWASRIADEVRAAPPGSAVRRLVGDALTAGAGDHIAVGLWSPLTGGQG